MHCATTGLLPFTPASGEWTAADVQQLYRRLGYGASPAEVADGLLLTPELLVQQLLATAAGRDLPPAPEWATWDYDALAATGREPFTLYLEHMQEFMLLSLEHGVREKLVLFWHNHFVVKYESHSCPSYLFGYFRLLTTYAFGNFRDLVREMTRAPAMLFFLNGFDNRRESPNENYARELFELFTLGENNGYSQQDIVEASRALTGWNQWTSYCGEVQWAPWGFDDGDKTVFGRSGNFDYAQLIDVLFEERGALIASFICRKLYRFYVNPEPDEAVVAALARTFVDSDFELLPVLRELFGSAHFFDPANRGVLIKSPMDLALGLLRQGGFGTFDNHRDWSFWALTNMGQQLGEPPDVAGWPGDRSWIDSNRISLRWELTDGFSWAVYNHDATTLVDFARQLTGNSREPEIIARAVVDYFIPRGLPDEAAYDLAVQALKWEVPANYYENGQWSLDWTTAPWQLVVLLQHLGRRPEFQLN